MQLKVNGINGNGNCHCMNVSGQSVTAGFRLGVNEIFALLGCYES